MFCSIYQGRPPNIIMNAKSDQPQLICIVKEDDEILGYLVVDTFVEGRSHGGIRIHQDVSETEIRLLANTMTWKDAFLGLPFGGAKAGVLGDPDAPTAVRREKLNRFGRAIEPLLSKELFVPAADMGTNLSDIREMLAAAGIAYQRNRLPEVSSGLYTAHSVFAGVRALAKSQGRSLQGLSAVIDGFGKVGSELARLLDQHGVQIVAVTTSRGALYNPGGLDIANLRSEYKQSGSGFVLNSQEGKMIDRELLWKKSFDVLCPCAQILSIDEPLARTIQASIVCPAANHPWSLEVERIFNTRGIVYWPEFAVNNGGILGTAMTYMAFSHEEIVGFMEVEYGCIFKALLDAAVERDLGIRGVCEEFARQHQWRADAGTRSKILSVFNELGLGMHRRGFVPGFLVRWYARGYFRSKLRFELPSGSGSSS